MSKQLDLFNDAAIAWKNEAADARVRDYNFDTLSGESLDQLYFPEAGENGYVEKLGFPGQYPYTRGIHANMYRGKLWTMRQFAGFGTPEETNERFHYLLSHGQTGLSVAYDMPTLMGYDPDHPYAVGEVGKCGVSVASLKDMERLFKSINLGDISVSQTINGPAIILFFQLSGNFHGIIGILSGHQFDGSSRISQTPGCIYFGREPKHQPTHGNIFPP